MPANYQQNLKNLHPSEFHKKIKKISALKNIQKNGCYKTYYLEYTSKMDIGKPVFQNKREMPENAQTTIYCGIHVYNYNILYIVLDKPYLGCYNTEVPVSRYELKIYEDTIL